MPIHCFTCENGHTTDLYLARPRKIPRRIVCPGEACGLRSVRDIGAEHRSPRPAANPAYYHYGLGQMVSSAREVDAICKKNGLVPVGLVRGG